MKYATLSAVLSLAAAFAAGGEEPAGNKMPFVRVSPRDGRYFELTDGRPFIPVGLNIVGTWPSDPEEDGLARMEKWIDALAKNGGNFARVWLSSGFWDVEHKRCGDYDERVARRIDRLLEMARRRGIRLKLTIEHFREINPDDPYAKRKSWATKALHHVSRGGTATSMDDWFTGAASRDRFRAKLRWYADRYGADPVIFGWELWNEVNAVRSGTYRDWTRIMLAELHRLFPKNLAMQSLGSFDRAGNREQYRWLVALEGNDVAQVHRYLDCGARLKICHGPVDVLAADAVRELRGMKPGKPIILAESGAVQPRHTGPFKLYRKDTEGIILHDVIFAPFFAGAAGTGQNWHWGKYVDANGLWWHFARFAAAVKGIDPPAEQFAPATIDHLRLRVYVLSGRTTLLAWCRDAAGDWRTELKEGRPPAQLTGLKIDLGKAGWDGTGSTRVYDPWKDRWTDAAAAGTTVPLPAFARSIVIRVTR